MSNVRLSNARRAMGSRCLPVCWAVAACLLLHAPVARADGDPASDVLLAQSLFVPGDAGIPAADQARLAQVVRAAGEAGFPIRVALIGSSYDLGSVYVLWGKPQTYARFLGTELSRTYHGRLLVVMPNGFGIFHGTRPVRAELKLLSRIPRPNGRAGLASAASLATRRLAEAAGHRLVVRTLGPAAAPARGHGHAAQWAIFGTGLGIVAAAWAVSLRLRPLGRR